MLSFWIVEHFDIVEHILPSFGPGFVGPAPYPFAVKQVEEALRDRIVMAVPTSAHGVLQHCDASGMTPSPCW